MDADAAKWIELVHAWLLKRFVLPLPEVTAMEEHMKSGIESEIN